MFYVYLIQSQPHPRKRYIGFTEDPHQRVTDHNRGCNPSTAPFTPWILRGFVAFDTKERALAFEHYLKSGSGNAFANKRLW